MKQKILFSVIGGLILFIWQFLSFAMPNFHQSSMTYTPQQEEILNYLDEIGMEKGMYALGQPDPSLSQEEQQKQMENFAGKPWAVINYHETMEMDMVMPMVRGIIITIITAFLLFWLFTQQKNPTLLNRILLSLAVGIISFLYFPYSNFIWYKEPDIWAYFADGIVPWLILGFIGHKMALKAVAK